VKKLKVKWTQNAEFDLEQIIEYIKSDSLSRAKKIFHEIKKKCQELDHQPERFRMVPELLQIGISKYREIIHKRWRIIFQVDNNIVYILIVIDSSRNLEDILFQRLIKKS